jgi:DNA repair exonuclease SbcCD ATPase subunit/DNA repair exonuclease SbcCD nuclease subunit
LKIAQISDVHIRKLKYHKEYRAVFEQLYESLRKEKPDIIVNTGDTFHTKLDLSPEAIRMMSELFENLSDIAPYHMLLGNHDMNLKNNSRLDAITPIVENLQHPNLNFHKFSETVSIAENIDLHVLSIVDPDNWVKDLPADKINIAAYHGSVVGSVTDTGWTMTHGDIDLETLERFDYALLGDIHKTNQTVDSDGRARYPGSLICQNHGETNDKGYLLWEIEGKNKFSTRHIKLTNPKPFITIELTPKGRLPYKIDIPSGARLRLVSNNNLPLSVMKKATNAAKHRFKPEAIAFLNRAAGERGSVDGLTDSLGIANLRDPVVQEELIREYLEDYQVEEELMKTVLKLNKKYNTIVEEKEEISRNINWKLCSFEWNNLFNYGEDNNIDFSQLSGVVGIFGKNFSGKSSIIDAILYTLFNSTSKNERKNLNVINQNKDTGSGKIEIDIGDSTYLIERHSEKYVKKLKGEETLEAKTELNFESKNKITGTVTNLNGLTRNETDKNIRRHLGTLEDFLMSSLAAQHSSLSFIDEGSTRRKEIVAKFLDLEVFEKKYKLAKEDSIDYKGALKRLEGKEYDEEINQAMVDLEDNETKVGEQETACRLLQDSIEQKQTAITEIEKSIDSIPTKIINITAVKKEIGKKTNQCIALSETNSSLSTEKEKKECLITKSNEFLNNIDIEELQTKEKHLKSIQETVIKKVNDITSSEEELNRNKLKAKLLDNIPCGTQHPSCKFIKDAHVAVANIPETESEIQDMYYLLDSLQVELQSDSTKIIYDIIDKYEKIKIRKQELTTEISDIKLKIEKNNLSSERLQNELKHLEGDAAAYDENKEAIENLEHLIKDKNSLIKQKEKEQLEIEICQEEVLELYKTHGSREQKLKSLQEEKEEYNTLREEYSAYDLYMRCMHSSGIAYDIIKKKLPVINQEIAKVLANIVEFEVFFEDNGRKFDIFIKHPNHDPRPIEMASGAEKSLAAMAIRLSLLSISSLPKGDLFILDEPGTALDEDNMDGFVRILELVKMYFKNVLLISHLDSLKDSVDMQVIIEKKDGYAYVCQ